jgi:hypothetical protein
MQKENLPSKKIIENALLKRALGYTAEDVVEEYTVDDNNDCKLCKKKVTKKHISPDISAGKMLLEYYENLTTSKYQNMTEEQLKQEKLKLIKLLKEEGENDAS